MDDEKKPHARGGMVWLPETETWAGGWYGAGVISKVISTGPSSCEVWLRTSELPRYHDSGADEVVDAIADAWRQRTGVA